MQKLKALIGAAVVAVALAQGAGVHPAAAAGADTARVVELVNAERAAHGLAPLRTNPQLTDAADAYAGAMASGNFFSHTAPDGSTMTDRDEAAGYTGWVFLGENLAAGQTTPERVVDGWMKSPAHRANVLADEAVEIGIGHAQRAGTRYGTYWAMEIGA
jgi:uncharacterized protein YkwD